MQKGFKNWVINLSSPENSVTPSEYFPFNVTIFILTGPFKYFPFHKSLVTIIIGMTIHGFGLGASVVGGFSDAHKSAIKCGFPDTIDTYGLVSGLWTSVFAFGAFVGKTN